MTEKKVVLTAKQIYNCPLHFTPGEQMILELPGVSKNSDKICAHVIQAFLPSLMAQVKTDPPKQNVTMTCPSENKVVWEVTIQENSSSEKELNTAALKKESIVERDLRRIPFFGSLPDYKMAKIVEKLVPYRCGPEQVLARQHEEYKALFLIANGVVDILQKNKNGEEVILTKLTRHDYFGEMSLLMKEISSVSIRPATPLTVIVLSKKAFNEILQEDRALHRHFEQYKGEHLLNNPPKKW
ncbi:MAG: cyclic nucleotide-binding domain-containing protein [Planctomycetota bacterium]